MKAAAVLFGAGLVLATSFWLGSVLLHFLKIQLRRNEQRLLALITGSGCLSAILFTLCTVHLVRKWVLLALAIGSGTAWWRYVRGRAAGNRDLQALPRAWRYLFLAVFAVFTVIYFFHAWAPEISPDGTAYHLAIVDHYYRAHGFEKVPTSIYFNISQGGELLFLMAYAFGKHSAAAMVHFGFLAMLPWLIRAYGQRFGFPVPATAAGLFVYVSPIFGVDGLSAYIDVALAAAIFAMFYLLQIWDEQRDDGLLVPAAILAGFSFALKYTAVVAAVYALGFVVWKAKRRARAVLIMSGIIAAFAVPWLVKSWMWVGNPIAPFGNRLFPNPWVHVSFERGYQAYLRDYGMRDLRWLPWEATVRGDYVSGLLGPLFLLAPLALVAVRWKQGRRLLTAALIMALPYATNVGTRFLIPAAPFVAVALAMVLAKKRWLLYSATVANAVLCFPAVVALYAGPSAWRVDATIPFRAALRLEPEDSFLRRRWPGYAIDRLIEDKVPRGEPVFLFSTTAEAYTTRRMLVGYLSGPNETLKDMLWTPLVAGYQPSVLLRFDFPRQNVRKVRAVKTGRNGDEDWSIAEFQVYADGHEVPRSPKWRLRARPNPWDVQLAFDNNPVTRWKTWEPGVTGDSVEIDFGQPQTINGAAILCSSDYTNKLIRLEVASANDEWRPVGGEMRESHAPVDQNWRLAATSELKVRGIHYLVVYKDDLGANDYRLHAAEWGMKAIGEVNDSVLYRIE